MNCLLLEAGFLKQDGINIPAGYYFNGRFNTFAGNPLLMNVLGMGNALVDIIIRLPDDDLLEELGLPKASMQLIDIQGLNLIKSRLAGFKTELSSGGSAANTAHGLAALGVNTGFIGSVGEDEYGNFFKADMEEKGIKPRFNYGSLPTGRAMALVSPDSERTFGTFLGAAAELSPWHIVPGLFTDYDLLHIEGYLVQNHLLIEKAVTMARASGMEVSLDLASYNVVEENRNFLRKILKENVTIVFANEDEARAMTGREPYEAVKVLQEMCGKAVVKVGKKGSWVFTGSKPVHVEAVPSYPVDTSGAGDLFAAGFIYGLSKGMPDYKCGMAGSILAGKVIEFTGPKIPLQEWEEVLARLKRIEIA